MPVTTVRHTIQMTYDMSLTSSMMADSLLVQLCFRLAKRANELGLEGLTLKDVTLLCQPDGPEPVRTYTAIMEVEGHAEEP
jgi:hypothetical protein